MQAVYIDKISLLHGTMTRCKLPQLDDVIEEFPKNTSKIKKNIGEGIKQINEVTNDSQG